MTSAAVVVGFEGGCRWFWARPVSGVRQLAAALATRARFPSRLFHHDQVDEALAFAAEAAAADARVVAYGHSWGGTAALEFARKLRRRVDLVVTLDPIRRINFVDVSPDEPPANAGAVVNFYQRSVSPLPPNFGLRGYTLSGRSRNILVDGATHASLDLQPPIQAALRGLMARAAAVLA